MKTSEELQVIADIQQDLLRELLKEKCTILQVLKAAESRAVFNAAKYKDRDSYEQMLIIKRSVNILKRYIQVTSTENVDCPDEPVRKYDI